MGLLPLGIWFAATPSEAAALNRNRRSMGILAIQYKSIPDSPILIACNREENLARAFQPPRIQSGRPRVVCGIDRKAGGTWGGVNQHGMFAAVVNCPKRTIPYDPRSRGLLCKELLSCRTAEEAIERAVRELETGCYAGGNFICVDRTSGGVVYGGNEVDVEYFKPGLHIISANRMDDHDDPRQEFVRRLLTLHRLDSAVAFLAVASQTFSRKPDISGKRGVIINEPEFGTVCSMLVSLTERTQKSILQFANGAPNIKPYEDVSALLRQVLSTDRSSQKKAQPKPENPS
ncbi:MAG: NRDE family protein [Planctomycetia bacterium]|nr:NRDE family protein [Planctomycetia bacterium]